MSRQRRVFLSYAREDESRATALRMRLEAAAFSTCTHGENIYAGLFLLGKFDKTHGTHWPPRIEGVTFVVLLLRQQAKAIRETVQDYLTL